MSNAASLIADLVKAGTPADLVGRVAEALASREAVVVEYVDEQAQRRRLADRERASSYRQRGWRLSDREWSKISTLIYQRDGRVCAYCGSTVGHFSIDHVVPVSRGGTHDIRNIVVACRRCNSAKGNRSLHEFMEGLRCR